MTPIELIRTILDQLEEEDDRDKWHIIKELAEAEEDRINREVFLMKLSDQLLDDRLAR